MASSPRPDATEAYSMESKKAQGAMNDALSNALMHRYRDGRDARARDEVAAEIQ